jgi:hypothetical protein
MIISISLILINGSMIPPMKQANWPPQKRRLAHRLVLRAAQHLRHECDVNQCEAEYCDFASTNWDDASTETIGEEQVAMEFFDKTKPFAKSYGSISSTLASN